MRVRASDPSARTVRVWLDGVEVTTQCKVADDEQGWVVLYKQVPYDNRPSAYLVCAACGAEKGDCECGVDLVIAMERRSGDVRIELGTR
jgi:hypothetical protein